MKGKESCTDCDYMCECCEEELTYRNQGGSWNTVCYPCRRFKEEEE